MECYTYLRNVTDLLSDGKTPYERRFGQPFLFVLETICTGAMRVIHIPVKTEETQRLRIKCVLYCPICDST